LDWVAKDNSSYSYPKSLYPGQYHLSYFNWFILTIPSPVADSSAFDPYNANAGNGRYANGTYLLPNTDPKLAYTAWNTSLATKYLTGLKNKPTILTIDNEIEIASSTHHDMHPTYVSAFVGARSMNLMSPR